MKMRNFNVILLAVLGLLPNIHTQGTTGNCPPAQLEPKPQTSEELNIPTAPGITDCTTLIKAPPGYFAEVIVIRISIPKTGSDCASTDVLTLDGGTSNIHKLCGQQLPPLPVYRASGNEMRVSLKLKDDLLNGVTMRYQYSNCGKATLTVDTSIKNFKEPIANGPTQCFFIFESSPTSVVEFTITDIKLPGKLGECDQKNVVIFMDGTQEENKEIMRVCGQQVPALPKVISSKSRLTMIIVMENRDNSNTGITGTYNKPSGGPTFMTTKPEVAIAFALLSTLTIV